MMSGAISYRPGPGWMAPIAGTFQDLGNSHFEIVVNDSILDHNTIGCLPGPLPALALCEVSGGPMRSARLLAVLFFLTSSTVFAATKAIKFGKLVDGTGRVFTNAVVIVEDDRVRSVTSGNASIPSDAEVIDLSRYTGVPGLIDAHTHIMWYWDGITTPRSEPLRHPAVAVFLAQENAQK